MVLPPRKRILAPDVTGPFLFVALLALAGCTHIPLNPASPVPLVPHVDLPRFMGDWYVIAHIPTFLDDTAHNAVENYRLNEDGTVATTYTNRQGGFDGKKKTMTPTGHIVPGTGNALWGMQFVPLVRGEYRVGYLAPDYSVTIIARSDLDYVWLMSRKSQMSDEEYAKHAARIAAWGYDVAKLMRVPQQWPEPAAAE